MFNRVRGSIVICILLVLVFLITACAGTKNQTPGKSESESVKSVQTQEAIDDTVDNAQVETVEEISTEESPEEVQVQEEAEEQELKETTEPASDEVKEDSPVAEEQTVETEVEPIEVASNSDDNKKQVWDDSLLSQQDAVNLLNYVQLSVSKVINSRSKGMLEEEFSSIINKINPTALQDSNIIKAYGDLLYTLTRLQLNEMEKEHILEIQKQKRKAAITNVFGSFGSVLTGVSPVQLAYAALNAALNYAKAVADANLEASEAEYQIARLDLELLNQQRSNLFITSATVFQGKANGDVGLITEEEMKSFAAIATDIEMKDKDAAQKLIPALLEKTSSFSYFAPFWVVFGNAYMKIGDYELALNCYREFEKLMEKDGHLFSSNSYYAEVAKNTIMILMLEESTDYETIMKYADILVQNTPNVTERRDDMHYFLIEVYSYCGDEEKANASMLHLINRGLEKKPQEGVLSTYLYSKGEGADSKHSYYTLKIYDGIKFGFDDYLKGLQSDRTVDFSNNIVFTSEFEITQVSIQTPKGKIENKLFHFYPYGNGENKKIYILDKTSWEDDLPEKASITLVCKIDDRTFTAVYTISETGTEKEFSRPIIVRHWWWGKYLDRYQTLISVQ